MVPFPVGILLSFFLFLYYSEINKFITTAITFAHLTLASIWKKIWEACEIQNQKHGSISCWYSVVILFVSLLFRDQQIYYNGNNFCAFDASLDLKRIWEACEIQNLKHDSKACWYWNHVFGSEFHKLLKSFFRSKLASNAQKLLPL